MGAVLSRPFLGLTGSSSEATTLLWTVLRGGPAIRVKSREKQLKSRCGWLESVVIGALAFTEFSGLVLVRVTGVRTTCNLLLAQLKARRWWVTDNGARMTRLCLGSLLRRTILVRNYLVQGCLVVSRVPTLLLLMTCFRMALMRNTCLGRRCFPWMTAVGLRLSMLVLEVRIISLLLAI